MTTKQKWDTVLSLLAGAGVFTLEAMALYKGVNGVSLTAAVAALAGLGGYKVHQFRKPKG